MSRQTTIHSRALARQGGLSMVELMVSMVLGLFLLLALTQILINGKDAFGSASYLSRLQENGRIATEMMVTDLKRAGYMGGNSDIPHIGGSEGPVAPDMSCNLGDTTWVRMVTQRVEGLDDTNNGYACIDNATYLRGDVVTVRYTSPYIVTGGFDGNKIYLRSSLFEGRIFLGKDKDQVGNQVADNPQNVRELKAVSYFIGDSGRTCNGAAVPSLFRVRVDDASLPITEELLPGVEYLEARYGDGERYYDADNVPDWSQILTMRIWLLVRTECAETGYTDGATYTMGDKVYKPNDGFRRQLYSNVVMVRNFKN